MYKKKSSSWLLYLVVVSLIPFISNAQCDPGAQSEHGINRCYDDGYIYVDVSGNSGGITTFWGCQNISQYNPAGFIEFHSTTTNFNGEVVQVLTDTYEFNAVLSEAPFYGTFTGPNLLIPDVPISRSIDVYTQPYLDIKKSGTNTLSIYWPTPLTGWKLQHTSSLISTNWVDVTALSIHSATNQSITISETSNSFYRLIRP